MRFPLLRAKLTAPDLVGLALPTAEKITKVAITFAKSSALIFSLYFNQPILPSLIKLPILPPSNANVLAIAFV